MSSIVESKSLPQFSLPTKLRILPNLKKWLLGYIGRMDG